MENADLKLSLDELKALFKRQEESFVGGREIAKSILVFATATLSIVLSITALKSPEMLKNTTFLILVGLAGIIFVVIIVISISLMIPETFWGPVEPKKENLETFYFGKNEAQVYRQAISDYLSVIKENAKKIDKRNSRVKIESVLMVLDVIIIALLIPL